MVSIGTSAPVTKVFITPERIPEHPSSAFGHPGDEYYMSVEVSNIENLWSTAFIVNFAPFAKTMVVSDVQEGDFLSAGGTYTTNFVYTIDALNGELAIGVTRIKMWGVPVIGAYGSGVLATFKFSIIDAGECDYYLSDVSLLDTDLIEIPAQSAGGYYHGCTANLIRIQIEGGRNQYVGGSMVVNARGINKGDTPIMARVRFDLERLDDGRRVKVYTGQDYAGGGLGEPLPFTYLYVDGYYAYIEGGWTNPGASLIGMPDGNYAESTGGCSITSMYTFDDLALAGRVVANVDLFGYTAQPDDTGNDFDPYLFSGPMAWVWCDSMGGSGTWAWTGGRYYMGGPYDMPEYYVGGAIHTEAAINAAEVLLHNYGASGPRSQIDAMRWKVEFSPIVPVDPVAEPIGPYPEEHDFAPFTIGTITDDMIGDYLLTATLEYTIAGLGWIEGYKTRTISFNIS
jgi:hypothetical protein